MSQPSQGFSEVLKSAAFSSGQVLPGPALRRGPSSLPPALGGCLARTSDGRGEVLGLWPSGEPPHPKPEGLVFSEAASAGSTRLLTQGGRQLVGLQGALSSWVLSGRSGLSLRSSYLFSVTGRGGGSTGGRMGPETAVTTGSSGGLSPVCERPGAQESRSVLFRLWVMTQWAENQCRGLLPTETRFQ